MYQAFVNALFNCRLSEVGQDTVVLSGLNSQAADSLKHIKRLYDETKYLKNYLDKVIIDVTSQLLSEKRENWIFAARKLTINKHYLHSSHQIYNEKYCFGHTKRPVLN